MVTFDKIKKDKTTVKVDGSVCGHIIKVDGGWQYQPVKASKIFAGLVYPSESECMNSLR